MDMIKLQSKVVKMIDELKVKVASMPYKGDFPLIYSEFKNEDKNLCLTDIILEVRNLPKYLDNYETDRWLSIVGYKLPVPYKCSKTLLKGNKNEILKYLNSPILLTKIIDAIPQLNFNLSDV